MPWDNLEKAGSPIGGGADYNENNMTYNQDIDEDTGLSVTYNSLGVNATPWNNITKN